MYVSFEVVGPNHVAVPTHYFKVIKTPKRYEAYIVPNNPIEDDRQLESFQTTAEKV